MSTNNEVMRVMVLPNEAAVTSGHISALGNGNWGLFNASNDTAVEVDTVSGGDAANVPDTFYVAYIGDGTLGVAGRLYKSAGPYIQLKNLKSYVQSTPATATNQKILITPSYDTVVEGRDYGIKLDFRGNTEVYGRFGYNQAVKTFIGSTACPLPDVDAAYANTVLKDIFYGIVNDKDQFLKATITYTGSGGAGLTIIYTPGTIGTGPASGAITGTGTIAELITLDDTAIATLLIEVLPISSMYTFYNINPKFFKLRQVLSVTGLAGASCEWATVDDDNTAFVQGTNYGYELKQLEYEAGGWEGKPGPYRQSALHGLPYTGFEYLIDGDSTQYEVHTLQYEHEYTAGWLQHKHTLTTYFVIVGNGSTGKTAINSMMDNIIAAGALATP